MNIELENTIKRLEEEVNKQAEIIQWYEKENRLNQSIINDDIKKINDLKISNDEWKRKCSKYKNTLNKIKEYINEYEVCLIKNGMPEISRSELVKIIEGVE